MPGATVEIFDAASALERRAHFISNGALVTARVKGVQERAVIDEALADRNGFTAGRIFRNLLMPPSSGTGTDLVVRNRRVRG